MWGNTSYSVDNINFSKGSLDPNLVSFIRENKIINLWLVSSSKEEIGVAIKDLKLADFKLSALECRDFPEGREK